MQNTLTISIEQRLEVLEKHIGQPKQQGKWEKALLKFHMGLLLIFIPVVNLFTVYQLFFSNPASWANPSSAMFFTVALLALTQHATQSHVLIKHRNKLLAYREKAGEGSAAPAISPALPGFLKQDRWFWIPFWLVLIPFYLHQQLSRGLPYGLQPYVPYLATFIMAGVSGFVLLRHWQLRRNCRRFERQIDRLID